jgi:acylphosphatase
MTDDQFTRIRVLIYGQVQNVGFRANTVKKAEKNNVTGWIRNRSDGRVEALAVGKKENIEKMLKWFKKGPSAATVEKVEVITKEEINYNPFENEFKINPTI